nr:hypothetical protein [Tanacetum cinerariifolium]
TEAKSFAPHVTQISSTALMGAGAICWNSKELEGEEDGRGASVLTLESVTRHREYLTLDLLSIIAKPSREGEEDGRGAFVLTLESVTRHREYITLDLLSIIAKPSRVLGSFVSFVASGSISTTGGGIGGPSYEIPLWVVMALALFLRFGMVLLGRELELKALLL